MIGVGENTFQVGEKHILLADVFRHLVEEVWTIFPEC
jgi:hypothetical protein